MKKKLLLDAEKIDLFSEALNNFHPEGLEKKNEAKTEQDIYERFESIHYVCQLMVELLGQDLPVLSNEVRAILGHLSDLEEEHSNLEKARGHLRRFGIDSLKEFCNLFDAITYNWLMEHAAYDSRGISDSYISDYATKFYEAHNQYISCQEQENPGSDKNHQIVLAYHKAAEKYLDLLKFHYTNDDRIKIELMVRRKKIGKILYWVMTLIIAILSTLSVIF